MLGEVIEYRGYYIKYCSSEGDNQRPNEYYIIPIGVIDKYMLKDGTLADTMHFGSDNCGWRRSVTEAKQCIDRNYTIELRNT